MEILDDRMAMTFSPLNKATVWHDSIILLVDLNNTTARNVEPVTDNDRILDVTLPIAPGIWSIVDIARAWSTLIDLLLTAPPVARTGFDVLDSAKYEQPQFVTSLTSQFAISMLLMIYVNSQ